MDTVNQILEFLPEWIHNSSYQVVIAIVIGLFTLMLIILTLKLSQKSQSSEPVTESEETIESDPCPFPNCVRCNKKSEILNKALERLDEYKNNNKEWPKLMNKVKNQLELKKYKYLYPLQKPVVFYLPGLKCKDWTKEILEIKNCEGRNPSWFNKDKLYKEYEKLKNDPKCSFKENSVDSGSWKIYHLVDQGVETNNAKFCTKTMKFVKNYPHDVKFMQGTKFSTVAFSCLAPGTVIPRHYGPTNFRIRCHFPLKYESEKQWVHVGFEQKSYCFHPIYFDDSFQHSARNNGNEDRVVLLFDVWHPDLKKADREFLQYIFSSDE